MAGTLRKAAWNIAWVVVLGACGCGKSEPPAPAVDPLLGAWCMQAEAASATGKRALGGSKWELRADGTYSYAFKWHRWDEPWTRSGSTLNLGKQGAHQIVELTPATLVLSQGEQHKFFGRDCGEEYAKAELVHQLVDAAENAASAKVEELLGRNADLNGIDTLGVFEQTALIAAVRANDLAMVKLLLARGARHDIETSQGVTAMTAAELAGYDDIIAELLKAGARRSSKPPVPPPPTAEEIENARVQRLLDLYPGALTQKGAARPAQPAAVLPVLPGAPALAPAATPTAAAAPAAAPKPEAPEPDKDLEAAKKELCKQRPANLDAPLSAEMLEMLKSIGMSPADYVAQQKAIYDQACN
jgi:hypothetical protein